MSPLLPSMMLDALCEKVSQIEGPLPSVSKAPSIWKALVATPQVKLGGNCMESVMEGLPCLKNGPVSVAGSYCYGCAKWSIPVREIDFIVPVRLQECQT